MGVVDALLEEAFSAAATPLASLETPAALAPTPATPVEVALPEETAETVPVSVPDGLEVVTVEEAAPDEAALPPVYGPGFVALPMRMENVGAGEDPVAVLGDL